MYASFRWLGHHIHTASKLHGEMPLLRQPVPEESKLWFKVTAHACDIGCRAEGSRHWACNPLSSTHSAARTHSVVLWSQMSNTHMCGIVEANTKSVLEVRQVLGVLPALSAAPPLCPVVLNYGVPGMMPNESSSFSSLCIPYVV